MHANALLKRQAAAVLEQNADGVPDALYPLLDLPTRPWMPRKRGRPIGRYTCLRWAIAGRRGRRLRTLMVGGIRCTCDAWALAFFESLTDSDGSEPARRSPQQARRDHDAAEAELDRAGLK